MTGWYYKGSIGGGFNYWPEGPHGQPQQIIPPVWGRAVVAENEMMYHQAQASGPAALRKPAGLDISSTIGVDPSSPQDRRIETFGSYSCRGVNGDPNARLSEHAFANAVDVSAFVLADGRRITVEADWNGRDQAARTFLRAIHEAGCRRFAIGLGPDANRFHYNHMHFDMGRGPYCH